MANHKRINFAQSTSFCISTNVKLFGLLICGSKLWGMSRRIADKNGQVAINKYKNAAVEFIKGFSANKIAIQ
jgi:hypothetical protein